MGNHIRLLATSDVHGYIYPYSYADKQEMNIGYARLHTLIKQLRDEDTILIDNGDVLEGSPLIFYHMHYHADRENPVARVLNQMHYDYINIGNHDYNYGEEMLKKYLDEVNAECITTNIFYRDQSFGGYVCRELHGKKIAIFGITTQYIPNWEKKEHIAESVFLDAYETASQMVKKIQDEVNPDYIVCVYHGGFERDLNSGEALEALTGENEGYRILKEIDGIDVLISGHQHRTLNGEMNGKIYTQTADKGAEIACIDIDTDISKITSRLYKAETEADPDILELNIDEEKACQEWLDQPLGESHVDLVVKDEDQARKDKSQVITFLNLVAMEHTGAMLSANALFKGATGFKREITMRDLVSTYVFPNTTVVKKINGRVLKEYLEKCAEYFAIKDGEIVVSPAYLQPKPMQYNYDMIDGISYTIDVSKPIKQRIISMKYQGNDVKEEDTFTLCISNYRASGGGDFDMLKDCETVKEYSESMVELLANYIMKNKVVDFEPVHNIKVINGLNFKIDDFKMR